MSIDTKFYLNLVTLVLHVAYHNKTLMHMPWMIIKVIKYKLSWI